MLNPPCVLTGGWAQDHEIGAALGKAAPPIGEDLGSAETKRLYRTLHARGVFIADAN